MKKQKWLASLGALAVLCCSAAGTAVHAADAGMAEAYQALLQEKAVEDVYTRYSLYDLTGDGEPELIYPLYSGSYAGYFTVITYRNSAAEELFGFECKNLQYNPDNHMFLSYKGSSEEHVYVFYELNGTSVVDKGRLTDYYDMSGNSTIYQCFIDGTEGDITKAEYTEYLKAFGYASGNNSFITLGNEYVVTDLSPLDKLREAAEPPTEAPTEATTAPADDADNPPTGETGTAAVVTALGAAILSGILTRKKEA